MATITICDRCGRQISDGEIYVATVSLMGVVPRIALASPKDCVHVEVCRVCAEDIMRHIRHRPR